MGILACRSPPLPSCPAPLRTSAFVRPLRELLRRSLWTCPDQGLRLLLPERIPHTRPPALPRPAPLPRLPPTANLILRLCSPPQRAFPGPSAAGPSISPSSFPTSRKSFQIPRYSLYPWICAVSGEFLLYPWIWPRSRDLAQISGYGPYPGIRAVSRDLLCIQGSGPYPGIQPGSVDLAQICGSGADLGIQTRSTDLRQIPGYKTIL
jgi:hypothetical protein